MALVGAPLPFARRVALRGLFTITIHRGRYVATAWPRPHKSRPSQGELDRREWLRAMVEATTHADSGTTSLIRDEVGGSATLARDVLTMMLAGTAFSLQLDDARHILPMRFRRRLERALDKVQLQGGGPLARAPSGWITIPPGPAGTMLTSRGPNHTAHWTT